MSDTLDRVLRSVDEQHATENTATRRQLVAGAGATLGGLGLLSLPGMAFGEETEADAVASSQNTPENILNVAATAEVLATIVNTVGVKRLGDQMDNVTRRNFEAAAREELIHYKKLTGALGARPATKRIWVPDKVFSSVNNLLDTVIVGDQIFINAYLIGTTVFGSAGAGQAARVTAQFMGVEAVHRALARQSRGLLGNDRAFIKFDNKERAAGPGRGKQGFTKIFDAVEQLQAAGFGFDERNDKPGEFFKLDKVDNDTPNPKGRDGVNTRDIAM